VSQALTLLLAVGAVSTSGLFAHRALAEATPLALAAWRLGLASVLFVGWAALRGDGKHSRPYGWRVWARLLGAGLCLALHFLNWFGALQNDPIARATLLACTTPLWAALIGLGRGRRPSAGYAPALALAGLGIGMVVGVHAPARASGRGDGLALAAGLLFALYLLCMEGLHRTISPRRQVTVVYGVAAVVLWLALLAGRGATLAYSPGVWWALLGLTLGPQIVGHTLLNASLRHFPASTVGLAILLEPIFTALLAWALLGQTVTPPQMLGGLLVLAGLALVIRDQSPAERASDEPVG